MPALTLLALASFSPTPLLPYSPTPLLPYSPTPKNPAITMKTLTYNSVVNTPVLVL
jgi:hypothetical protein